MPIIKRSTNFFTSANYDNKKSRQNFDRFLFMTNVRRFEHLSNDLFYEIFEYLDGFEILKAFSNLNNRFQKLIQHPSLRLKLIFDETFKGSTDDYCKQILIPNAYRLISLQLKTENFIRSFLKFDGFYQSFQYLESMMLNELSLKQLQPILHHLRSTTRLNSLNIIVTNNNPSDIDLVYDLVFSFPFLKSLTIDISIDWENEDLMVSNRCPFYRQSNSIQTLNIKHSVTFYGLQSLLQYTPGLRRLKCEKVLQPNQRRYKHRQRLITLSQLKYIEIRNCIIEFFELELLMQNIGVVVEILKLNVGFDLDYLNGQRWETFIIGFMPHLKRFYLDIDEFSDLDQLVMHDGIHRFHSQFWIERHWSSQLDVNSSNIRFSIAPIEKQWFDMHREIKLQTLPSLTYDLQEKNVTSSTLIHLTTEYDSDDHENIELLTEIQPFIGSIKYNQLTMKSSSSMSIGLLLMMIDRSPFLNSLILSFENLLEFDEYSIPLPTIETITKLKMIQNVDFELVEVLFNLFPRLEDFELDCSSHTDLIRLLRLILIKKIEQLPNLNSLCFNIITADEKLLQTLRHIVTHETRIQLHTLKRIGKQIFVQWIPK